jgi:hypothetical protein
MGAAVYHRENIAPAARSTVAGRDFNAGQAPPTELVARTPDDTRHGQAERTGGPADQWTGGQADRQAGTTVKCW